MKNFLFFLLLSCAAWAAYGFFSPHGQIVEIVRDGRVTQVIDLSEESDGLLEIRSGRGYNILEIKDGTIRVAEADCPNLDCVKMGVLRSANMPLICIPHGLTVRFKSDAGKGLDSITQ